MKNTDIRRYRRPQDGVVFRVVEQARSPYGPVELVSLGVQPQETIHTTNDKLSLLFDYFEAGARKKEIDMKKQEATERVKTETPEDLEEWRWYDDVVKSQALLLAIRYPDFNKGELEPFWLYDKTNRLLYEITVGFNAEIESVACAKFYDHGYDREKESDSYSEVRLFDPTTGCVIPWPPKPYPNVKEYLAVRKEFERLQKLQELEEQEVRAKQTLEKIAAAKAALLPDTKKK